MQPILHALQLLTQTQRIARTLKTRAFTYAKGAIPMQYLNFKQKEIEYLFYSET